MRDLAEAAQHVKALDRSFTSPKVSALEASAAP
jgi:hypothetical protein